MILKVLSIVGTILSVGFSVFLLIDYKRALKGKKSVLFEVEEREE